MRASPGWRGASSADRLTVRTTPGHPHPATRPPGHRLGKIPRNGVSSPLTGLVTPFRGIFELDGADLERRRSKLGVNESGKRAAARALCREQDGLITAEQARVIGFSVSAIGRRLAGGEWVMAEPRVYRDAAVPETARSRVRAAASSVGDGTLIGRTAAWWWHLTDEEPEFVELAVAPHRRLGARAGVRLTRREPDADADVVIVDGLRVTKRAPTLLEACGDSDPNAGAKLLDHALLSGRVGLDELRDVHARTTPRRGSSRVRALLVLAAGGARSQAERVAIRAIRAEKITGWVANLEVQLPLYGSAVLDLAFPELRIAVEIDGWAYHRDLRAFLRDARRQNGLASKGWLVIRTNWYELHQDPAAFIRALCAAIAQRSRGLKFSAR